MFNYISFFSFTNYAHTHVIPHSRQTPTTWDTIAVLSKTSFRFRRTNTKSQYAGINLFSASYKTEFVPEYLRLFFPFKDQP